MSSPDPIPVSFVSYREGEELIEARLDDVEFEGIQEDYRGRDLVTFTVKGVLYESYVFTRYIDADEQ